MTSRFISRLMTIALIAFTVHALAQDDADQGRRHHGMPPELRAQLSDDQIQQLEAATSFEERKALLDSWGIRPPARHGHHGPPPPPANEDAQSGSDGQH